MDETRRILVTGGTGYVGSKLVPMLAKNWPVTVLCSMHFGNPIANTPNVRFVKGDIRSEEHLRNALAGCTDVIHLAAIVTDELVDMNPALAKKVNVDGMNLLCDLAVEAGVGRFIYASSSSVYGASDKECDETTPPNPMSKYAEQKLVGEEVLLQRREALNGIIVRCATCCGPAPRMRLDTIVNIFSAQSWFDRRIMVFGGDQWRTNVHVEDACSAYEFLLDAPTGYDTPIYNVAREPMQAATIARLVQYLLGGEIHIDSSKKDLRHYRMKADKLRGLGWGPTNTITKAITDNALWFQEGHVTNYRDPLYHNTQRMAEIMLKGE